MAGLCLPACILDPLQPPFRPQDPCHQDTWMGVSKKGPEVYTGPWASSLLCPPTSGGQAGIPACKEHVTPRRKVTAVASALRLHGASRIG